jgi:hypothetical protein
VLGYHGCDRTVGERVLRGEPFIGSNNEYDWLGPGTYFWEANPQRGLEFAAEAAGRKHTDIKDPFVIGAVIDLGQCLDLTTAAGIELVRSAYDSLAETMKAAGLALPRNSDDRLRRNLDCAVMRRVHSILESAGSAPLDTVKGVFTEGKPVYPGAGFDEKTHIQIAVCNLLCIKGAFRVPPHQIVSPGP